MKHDPKLKIPVSQRPKLTTWGKQKDTKPTPVGPNPALAARLNVTGRGLENEFFVEATLHLLSGGAGQTLSSAIDELRTRRMTGEQVQEALHSYRYDLSNLPSAHFEQAYVFPPPNYPGPVSCAGYAARFLSRNADPSIIDVFENKLAVSHESHGDDLNRLRSWNREIYAALVGGYPVDALRVAKQKGREAVSFVRPIVQNHTMLLSVATAHVRMAQLAQCAKAPLGRAWTGQAIWPTMSSVAHAALIAPTQAISRLLTLPADNDVADDEAEELLKTAGLLDDDASSHVLISMAKDIQKRLPEHSLTYAHFRHTAREILKAIDPLQAMTATDLSGAGWTRRSFVRERFGVDATEGAALLAMNLLTQRARIHACIEALLSEKKLPEFEFNHDLQSLGKKSLARLTEALRIACKADRAAPDQLSAPENNTAKKLVKDTLAKVEQGQIDRAIEILRIDPAVFFRRKMAPSTSANRGSSPQEPQD